MEGMENKNASIWNINSQKIGKEWCQFQLDSGRLAKRCFFKDVNDNKPKYLFGMQVGGDSNSHTSYVDVSAVQNEESGKTVHSILHDTMNISPKRYENSFNKLFKGAQELDAECKEDYKDVGKYLEGIEGLDNGVKNQHPSRLLENSRAKNRIIGERKEEDSIEAQKSLMHNQSKFLTSSSFSDKQTKRMQSRNMNESSFWKTCFRDQNIESGTLVDTDLYHKQRNVMVACEKKPYKTDSDTVVPSENATTTLEKLKEKSNQHGLGWQVNGRSAPNNSSYPDGRQSVDSYVDPNEGRATRLLNQTVKARIKAENELKSTPYLEQGLKRSECSWYRKIKTM